MIKFIRSFYSYPNLVQWFLSIIIPFSVIYYSIILFSELYFPFNLILIPFFKVAGHFSITPLLRLSGFLNYHSPFFLTVKYNKSYWEIHNGTTFDYVKNMRWSYRGGVARNITIKNYFSGLLNLINEIKKDKNPKHIEITGTSYFIGKNTISRIGFKEERVKIWQRFLFLIDYLNLLIMYSFSKGKILFPSIFSLKKVRITGDQLIKSEAVLKRYLSRFGKNSSSEE